MISNNSGDQIVPAAKAAQAKGIKVVTWTRRSPRPRAKTYSSLRSIHRYRQGDGRHDPRPHRTGGGKFAILSASPDAANQNAWIAGMKKALKDPKYAKLKLVDTVYGNDEWKRAIRRRRLSSTNIRT